MTLETQSFKVGDEITLKLMKREKNTTYAVPVHQWKKDMKPYYVDGGFICAYYISQMRVVNEPSCTLSSNEISK